MYPRDFQYFAPRSITEVIGVLSRYGEKARLLAGGQSLIPLMKLRLANLEYVVDIGRLPGLAYIRQEDSFIVIGALTTHADVVESTLVRQRFPLMADAVSVIGDAQVRNWGTVGGALAEADPAGDWGPVALALDARIRCIGSKGERVLGADSFFVDAYTTQLASDELLTEIAFPVPARRSAGAYLKLERRAGDFAIVSTAVQLSLDGQGICQGAAIVLGAAGMTPIKAVEAEAFLVGKEVRQDVVEEAAVRVSQAGEPLTDIRGSEEYKRAAARALFKRAVGIAARRHRGETLEAGHVR
ncbi:MAG: FAD binding domain-containing protein [Candidatus Binatia bacterium]